MRPPVLVEALVIRSSGGVRRRPSWMALTGLLAAATLPIPMRFLFILPQPSLILVALLISVLAGVLFRDVAPAQIFQGRSK